jgi:hypothetical protein
MRSPQLFERLSAVWLELVGLFDKRAQQVIKRLFVLVIEVEIEVKQRLTCRILLKLFYDGGAKHCLATSWYAVEPQEGLRTRLPPFETIALEEPAACPFVSLLQRFVIVGGRI